MSIEETKNKSRINILYLITEFDVGGAEKMLYKVATRIDRKKYNPVAACLTGHGAIGKKLSESGVDVEYLNMQGKVDLRIFLRLISLLKRKNIKILHTYLFHANFVGRIAGRIAGTPIIISSIRVSEREKHYHLWLSKLTSGFVDMETCVCKAVREFSLKQGRIASGKLIVIHNGIDLKKFNRKWDSEGTRTKLGIDSSTKVVGTVSRLTKQKGIEFLLGAASKVMRNVPDSIFIIVGEGELKSEFQQLAKGLGIKEKVIFTGFRRDVLEIVNIFDVFALSSLWEGMPVALLEAMAASKPVVATAVGGCKELILNGENGFLIKPSDVGELSKAIIAILRDPKLASKMAQNSRKRAEQFSVETMVKRTETLYETLLYAKYSIP